jgi:hypothetical protein
MSLISQQIFTDAGINMLGQANAGGTLNIQSIVVGSGSAVAEADIYPLIALITFEQAVTITRKTDLGNGKLVVSGILNESLITGSPFQLRELGIMANVDGAGDQLYCASNVFGDIPDTVTPGGTSSHSFDIYVEIDRATTVNVTIGDPTTVDVQNIGAPAVGPGAFSYRTGNIFFLKRFVQGIGMILSEDGDTITIAQKVLEVDLDLYVFPTATDVAPNFTTIQKAHDYLLPYFIPSNRLARINVSADQYTGSTIQINHPQANRIQILGAAPVIGNINSISNVNTSSFNVVLASNPGFLVGQLVVLRLSADPRWSGVHSITAVSGNTITLSKNMRGGIDWTTAVGAGGQLVKFPTTLYNPTAGVMSTGAPAPLGKLQNFTLQGGGGTDPNKGWGVNGMVKTLDSIVAWNLYDGIWLTTGGVCSGSNIYISSCQFGLVVEGGNTFSQVGSCIYNGNYGVGALVRWGGSAGFGVQVNLDSNVTHFIANPKGLQVQAASAYMNNCGSHLNTTSHYVIDNGSLIGGENTAYVIHSNINTTDGYAADRGFLKVIRNGGTYATTNPASGVVGNNQGYIIVY